MCWPRHAPGSHESIPPPCHWKNDLSLWERVYARLRLQTFCSTECKFAHIHKLQDLVTAPQQALKTFIANHVDLTPATAS